MNSRVKATSATLVFLLTGVFTPPVFAEEASSAASRYNETVAERTARLNAEYYARYKKVQESRRSGVRVFKGSDTTVGTNSPSRFRGKTNYREIDLNLTRISVPKDYANRDIARYSTKDYDSLVAIYARKYSLDKHLVNAVIKAESNFNPRAKSPKGAGGLMQLMPGTAKDMGVTNVYDPAQNIAGGTQYLAKMMEIFKGDIALALAGYNAGPGAVKKHGGIPPYSETKEYISRVKRNWLSYRSGKALPDTLLVAKTVNFRTSPRTDNRYFTVHFKSGLVQPAEDVREGENGYYTLQWRGKAWPVRKDLVKEIIEPANG